MLESAWSGVDLTGVIASRSHGMVQAADGQLLGAWFNSSVGVNVSGACDDNIMALMVGASHSVSSQLQVVAFTQSSLNTSGHFWQLSLAGKRLPSQGVQVEFEVTCISFAPQWANPLWAALEN